MIAIDILILLANTISMIIRTSNTIVPAIPRERGIHVHVHVGKFSKKEAHVHVYKGNYMY